ncbi:MAG: efflux transporter outer membrane subunit, partial [Acidiferrobacteraceae bacterium]
TRQKTSGAGFGGSFPGHTFTLYTGNIIVSYSPDLFGLNRLVARAQQAQVDKQRFLRDETYLTLEGNIANTVIQQAALNSEIRVTDVLIQRQRALTALVRKQYRAGALPYASVLTQRQQLATTEANRVMLEQQLAATRHALAALTGVFPATAGPTRFTLAGLTLPARLPVALPSTLVRRRPDIRAAEAGLRFANASVGEAVARMYPLLSLSAGYGAESNRPGDFFLPADRVYDLAAGLTAPIWEGGTLRAQKRAAVAAYEGAIAGYQGTVLAAFQQVADALRALQYDARTLVFQQRAVAAGDRALKLSEMEYRDGAVQYLTVLTAEIQDATARSAYVQARAQRYRDTVGLLVALGSGWWPDVSGTAASPRRPAEHHTRLGP